VAKPPKLHSQSRPLTPYEQLGTRLKKAIGSPAAQKAQAVTVYKEPYESEELWDQIISEIAENDGVYLTKLEDEGIRIFWEIPDQD